MPLTPEQAAFLTSFRVARLATVDRAGRPYNVPVCFALHAGRLYIVIDEKPKRIPPERLRRVRNIEDNPAVCLVVDQYDEDWLRLAWLQVHGDAALVDDEGERAAALAALKERYPQYAAMTLVARPLLGITPRRVTVWRAASVE
jgi:PPOX class probable F420-dependent enzyme